MRLADGAVRFTRCAALLLVGMCAFSAWAVETEPLPSAPQRAAASGASAPPSPPADGSPRRFYASEDAARRANKEEPLCEICACDVRKVHCLTRQPDGHEELRVHLTVRIDPSASFNFSQARDDDDDKQIKKRNDATSNRRQSIKDFKAAISKFVEDSKGTVVLSGGIDDFVLNEGCQKSHAQCFTHIVQTLGKTDEPGSDGPQLLLLLTDGYEFPKPEKSATMTADDASKTLIDLGREQDNSTSEILSCEQIRSLALISPKDSRLNPAKTRCSWCAAGRDNLDLALKEALTAQEEACPLNPLVALKNECWLEGDPRRRPNEMCKRADRRHVFFALTDPISIDCGTKPNKDVCVHQDGAKCGHSVLESIEGAFTAGRSLKKLTDDLSRFIERIRARWLKEHVVERANDRYTTEQLFPTYTFRDAIAVGDDRALRCSGVVVGPNAVLTAAHCLPVTRIFLGEDAREAGESVEVAETARHPDDAVDAALLRTRRKLDITASLLRGPKDTEAPSGPLIAVGFGASDARAEGPFGRKRAIDLSANGWGCSGSRVASTGCKPLLEMLIPGVPGGDTCAGDSGGPLYELARGVDTCAFRLLGITSRRTADATAACGSGGIYVRTDRMRNWIDELMRSWSSK